MLGCPSRNQFFFLFVVYPHQKEPKNKKNPCSTLSSSFQSLCFILGKFLLGSTFLSMRVHLFCRLLQAQPCCKPRGLTFISCCCVLSTFLTSSNIMTSAQIFSLPNDLQSWINLDIELETLKVKTSMMALLDLTPFLFLLSVKTDLLYGHFEGIVYKISQLIEPCF